jgi:hypothetical protein
MRRILLIGVVLVVGGLGFAAWFFAAVIKVATDGTGPVHAGELAYWLWVSGVVKDAPITEPCTPAVYEEYGRDGERSPYAIVAYTSRAGATALYDAIDAFARRHKCGVPVGEPVDTSRPGARRCDDAEMAAFTFNAPSGAADGCQSVELAIDLAY